MAHSPDTYDACSVEGSRLLPPDHPARMELNDEVHARPPVALHGPARLTSLAIVADDAARDTHWQAVCALAESQGVAPPPRGSSHVVLEFAGNRLVYERHSEFTRFVFIVSGAANDPFAEPAIHQLDQAWVSTLPGQVLVATHVALLPVVGQEPPIEDIAARYFAGNTLVGARIGGDSATAFTDFRIHADGFSRMLILDRGMTSRQAGRMAQRLFEIDCYRMLALLALPTARQLGPAVQAWENELAGITTALEQADESMEQGLLLRLTKLEAAIQRSKAQNNFRFGAAAAYYGLVQRRIVELREERIKGVQNFDEFTERRLAPAMANCRNVAERQRSLSQRVAQVTQLLSTRVDLTREKQNQSLLESMDRRAALQLRLQSTVEGLSVAAVTYYVVGLVGYAVKGIKTIGFPIDATVATAVSVPVVALLAALGIRRIRRKVEGSQH